MVNESRFGPSEKERIVAAYGRFAVEAGRLFATYPQRIFAVDNRQRISLAYAGPFPKDGQSFLERENLEMPEIGRNDWLDQTFRLTVRGLFSQTEFAYQDRQLAVWKISSRVMGIELSMGREKEIFPHRQRVKELGLNGRPASVEQVQQALLIMKSGPAI